MHISILYPSNKFSYGEKQDNFFEISKGRLPLEQGSFKSRAQTRGGLGSRGVYHQIRYWTIRIVRPSVRDRTENPRHVVAFDRCGLFLGRIDQMIKKRNRTSNLVRTSWHLIDAASRPHRSNDFFFRLGRRPRPAAGAQSGAGPESLYIAG